MLSERYADLNAVTIFYHLDDPNPILPQVFLRLPKLTSKVNVSLPMLVISAALFVLDNPITTSSFFVLFIRSGVAV